MVDVNGKELAGKGDREGIKIARPGSLDYLMGNEEDRPGIQLGKRHYSLS